MFAWILSLLPKTICGRKTKGLWGAEMYWGKMPGQIQYGDSILQVSIRKAEEPCAKDIEISLYIKRSILEDVPDIKLWGDYSSDLGSGLKVSSLSQWILSKVYVPEAFWKMHKKLSPFFECEVSVSKMRAMLNHSLKDISLQPYNMQVWVWVLLWMWEKVAGQWASL